MGVAAVPCRRGRARLALRWVFVMSLNRVASHDVCDMLIAWRVTLTVLLDLICQFLTPLGDWVRGVPDGVC